MIPLPWMVLPYCQGQLLRSPGRTRSPFERIVDSVRVRHRSASCAIEDEIPLPHCAVELDRTGIGDGGPTIASVWHRDRQRIAMADRKVLIVALVFSVTVEVPSVMSTL